MRRSVIVMGLLFLVSGPILSEALADSHGDFSNRLKAAITAESRPAGDKERDANRLPKQTLAFFGIDSNQRVLELLPGGGWYTRLLAPVLDGSGKLYLAFGGRLPKELQDAPFMKNVEMLDIGAELKDAGRRGLYGIEAFDFGVRDLDAVLTFRNLHNLTPAARVHFNEAIFDSLRPGGTYGVIDHTRRHMQPDDKENGRRLDPVLVIEEAQTAGFVFEATSPLHYRPVDELRLEVGHDSVKGQTDRFTLRFRKPGAGAALEAPHFIP